MNIGGDFSHELIIYVRIPIIKTKKYKIYMFNGGFTQIKMHTTFSIKMRISFKHKKEISNKNKLIFLN